MSDVGSGVLMILVVLSLIALGLAVIAILVYFSLVLGQMVYENYGAGGLIYSSVLLASLFRLNFNIEKPRKK